MDTSYKRQLEQDEQDYQVQRRANMDLEQRDRDETAQEGSIFTPSDTPFETPNVMWPLLILGGLMVAGFIFAAITMGR